MASAYDVTPFKSSAEDCEAGEKSTSSSTQTDEATRTADLVNPGVLTKFFLYLILPSIVIGFGIGVIKGSLQGLFHFSLDEISSNILSGLVNTSIYYFYFMKTRSEDNFKLKLFRLVFFFFGAILAQLYLK